MNKALQPEKRVTPYRPIKSSGQLAPPPPKGRNETKPPKREPVKR